MSGAGRAVTPVLMRSFKPLPQKLAKESRSGRNRGRLLPFVQKIEGDKPSAIRDIILD